MPESTATNAASCTTPRETINTTNYHDSDGKNPSGAKFENGRRVDSMPPSEAKIMTDGGDLERQLQSQGTVPVAIDLAHQDVTL
ncbi:hypothetical protein [Mesorhizobium sp. M0859]|uniref:hypothetical protein n=1 Tax=Mesorhizobium sp. M0859 TaxID=2957014 RepID=UPI00333B4378